jgi:DNA-binding response OmpR family regulator
VAEDDDDCLLVLKTLLSGKGYQVLAAWDGKQALEIANTEEFDLVILDLQLPRLSGLSVIHHLRRRPELESVPIVIMTGWAPEEYREKAIEAGCDDFLVKPIDFDHLDAVLDYFAPIPTAEAMGAA